MKLVYGVGVNDSKSPTQKTTSNPELKGKRIVLWRCPFYRTWHSMLERCYSYKYQEKYPSYIGCHVCEEWLTFSNFKDWMEKQDYRDKQLDKDLLVRGNKLYSPETCLFIDMALNKFLTDSLGSRGEHPIGVSFNVENQKFRAYVQNPFTSKKEHLGYYACPNEAHRAWRARKLEIAVQIASFQQDERVSVALSKRYEELEDIL